MELQAKDLWVVAQNSGLQARKMPLRVGVVSCKFVQDRAASTPPHNIEPQTAEPPQVNPKPEMFTESKDQGLNPSMKPPLPHTFWWREVGRGGAGEGGGGREEGGRNMKESQKVKGLSSMLNPKSQGVNTHTHTHTKNMSFPSP